MAADAQLSAVLRPRRNLQRHSLPVWGRNLDGGPESGLRVRDGHLDDEIRAAPLKPLRRLHTRDDEEIACRSTAFADLTLALQPNPRAVLDAGRNLHGVAPRAALATRDLALLARLLDDSAVPATARARL